MNSIESIQEDILDLRELVLELDDRIWSRVNHQNPEALQTYLKKKEEINQRIASFKATMGDLLEALDTAVAEDTNNVASWVFHCHILRHEDRGMMMIVKTKQKPEGEGEGGN